MKKLSNRLSVKQSSTKEGQRELLREHTNKISEIIEYCELLEQRINMMGIAGYPYTAMRSTGGSGATGEPPYGTYPIKPQENVKEKLMDYLKKINNPHSKESWLFIEDQADKILAIVKGE